MRHKIAIIGAGPGGVTAAVQCKRLGFAPFLIDQTGKAGGLARCAFAIENYPGLPPTDGRTFARLLENHLARFDIEIVEKTVTLVEPLPSGYRVHMNGDTTRVGALIVAIGTTPTPLTLPGARLAAYDPLRALESGVDSAVIIGGGEAALDYALSLATTGAHVTVLVRSARLKAVGRLVDLARSKKNINIIYNTTPTQISKNSVSNRLRIETDTPSSPFDTDTVIGAIGRTPRRLRFAKGLDETTCKTVSTPHPGLFLVGDVRFGTLGQVGMAVGDGLEAAAMVVDHLGGTNEGFA